MDSKECCPAVEGPPVDPDAPEVTLDGLLLQLGGDPATPQPTNCEPANDEDCHSSGDIEWLKAKLEEDGPNPEIERILAEDRANHGETKRRRLAQRIRAGGRPTVRVVPTPDVEVVPVASVEVVPPAVDAVPPAVVLAPPPLGASPHGIRHAKGGYPIPAATEVMCIVDSLQTRDTRELLADLAQVCDEVRALGESAYPGIRSRVWAINRVLTNRGETAPCTRPFARLPFVPPASMSDIHKTVLNDRKMFDLEYLRRQRWGKPKPKWTSLLRAPEFDAERGATLIGTVGAAANLIDALGLRDEEQMHLAAIRDDKVRKRWERIEAIADRLEDSLRGVAGLRVSKVRDEDVPRWREEFIALTLAKGSPSDASRLMLRLYGRARPASQLANRKRDLAAKGFSVAAE